MILGGLHRWLSGKETTCNAGDAGDTGLIGGSGRSPGGGRGNPLEYSCLEKPMDRGAWGAMVHRVAEWKVSEHTRMHDTWRSSLFECPFSDL